MEKGRLIVNVFLEKDGQPVDNALVAVTGQNYFKTFFTDANGKTEAIELDAPDKKYSLVPQHVVKPYSTYNIKVTKDNLNTVIVKDVEILPGETSIQKVYMKVKPGTTEVIDLPEHHLWDENAEPPYPDYELENDNTELRVLPYILIPEYILVINGTPTSGATILTVPFIDYIKNVASSEIYSTWHTEAIKANVHAIVSFTLNRIYTEFYLSKGYNFTISASPSNDQMYVHNRTIFQTISNVVDVYFNQYIKLSGKDFPFFAQYNDGIQTNVPGRLSQWGAQNLALQGRSAIQILRHFYQQGLDLYTANQTVGLPNSFPGVNLSIGSCSEAVQKVQIQLNRIRGNFPGIPIISPANGRYENSTKRAVEVFQEIFNLPQTGIINFATWFEISRVFGAVAGLQQGV